MPHVNASLCSTSTQHRAAALCRRSGTAARVAAKAPAIPEWLPGPAVWGAAPGALSKVLADVFAASVGTVLPHTHPALCKAFHVFPPRCSNVALVISICPVLAPLLVQGGHYETQWNGRCYS